MNVIDRLTVLLEANSSSLDSSLNLANVGMSKLATAASSLAGAFSFGVIANQIQTLTGELNSLNDFASKLGISTKEFQELGFTAEQSGISANTMGIAMQRFTRRMADAAQGTGVLAKVVPKLGISLKDSEGNIRGTTDLLSQVAEKIKDMPPAEQVLYSFKFFDSGGVELNRLLKQGEAGIKSLVDLAGKSGAVINDDLIQMSGAYHTALNLNGLITKSIWQESAARASSGLKKMTDSLNVFLIKNRQFIVSGITTVFSLVSTAAEYTGIVLGRVSLAFGQISDFVSRFSGILKVVAAVAIPNLIVAFGLLGAVLKTLGIGILILVIEDLLTHMRGGNSVIGLLIQKFEEFEKVHPILAGLAKAFGVLFTVITVGLAKAFITAKIIAFSAAISTLFPIITGLSALLIVLGTIAKAAFLSALTPIAGLITAIGIIPILIALAVAGVVAAGVIIYKNFDEIKEKVNEVYDQIKEFLDLKVEKIVQWVNSEIVTPVIDSLESPIIWFNIGADEYIVKPLSNSITWFNIGADQLVVKPITSFIEWLNAPIPALEETPGITAFVEWLNTPLPLFDNPPTIEGVISWVADNILTPTLENLNALFSWEIEPLPDFSDITVKGFFDWVLGSIPTFDDINIGGSLPDFKDFTVTGTLEFISDKLPEFSLPDLSQSVDFITGLLPELPSLSGTESTVDYVLGLVPDAPKFPKIKSVIDYLTGLLPDVPEFPDIKSLVLYALGFIPEIPSFDDILFKITGFLGQLPVVPELNGVVNFATDHIKEAFNDLVSTLKGLWSDFKDFFTLPKLNIPEFKLPSFLSKSTEISAPDFSQLKLPEFNFNLPSANDVNFDKLASIEIPDIPSINFDAIEIPDIPSINFDAIEIPDIPSVNFDAVSIPDIPSVNFDVVAIPDIPSVNFDVVAIPDIPNINFDSLHVPDIPDIMVETLGNVDATTIQTVAQASSDSAKILPDQANNSQSNVKVVKNVTNTVNVSYTDERRGNDVDINSQSNLDEVKRVINEAIAESDSDITQYSTGTYL